MHVLLNLLVEYSVCGNLRPEDMVESKALLGPSVHKLVVLDTLPELILFVQAFHFGERLHANTYVNFTFHID